MKVFVSSVRRGLEEERDALPSLIAALGHEALRFEDFTAQAVPSREACVRGVGESDVYVLLLGPHYGHVFPETRQSATHDEFVAARMKGIPVLVFRKTGVEFEPEQEEFARHVGDYATGRFYAPFGSAAHLLTEVARALREVAAAPAALTYEHLAAPVHVEWLERREPALELHVVPLAATRHPARVMRDMADVLVTALRRSGVVPMSAGVTPIESADAVTVEVPDAPRRWDDVTEGRLAGVRVSASGQASVWHSLPRDTLGPILDPDHLRGQVATALRFVGLLGVLPGDRFAIGIGLAERSMVTEGRFTGIARSSATLGMARNGSLRIAPDESVSAAAFDRGADDVAAGLVTTLLTEFRRTQ